ncbi:MAG: sigma factor-like helix-turn-helix DNA-binding protein [bacterium]
MNPHEIVNNLIKPLPQRTKEILRRRFGLNRKKPQTLQEIGSCYGLTRERIRQIQDKALASIKKRDIYKPILFDLKKIFIKHKKLVLEQRLSQELKNFQAPYFLILNIDDNFLKFCDSQNFECHWSDDSKIADQTQKNILALTAYLQSKKELVSKKEVSDYVDLDYLEISKLIAQNIFGDFGLADWPEITPAGIKDKAYIILKRNKEPLHFKDIANLINKANFPDGRIAYEPTVHNELIKDPRFVLEGRGVYFLRDAEKKRS